MDIDKSRLVSSEVQDEVSRLKAVISKRKKIETVCKFCAFRTVRETRRLLDHIETYHVKDRLFCADSRSQGQWSLARALFNQYRLTSILNSGLDQPKILAQSATLLREWNPVDEETKDFLSKRNELDIVMCFGSSGPKYILVSSTTGYIRLHRQLYYDNEFANLLMALCLKHRCKAKALFKDVMAHWMSQGSQCVLLYSGSPSLSAPRVAGFLF